MCGPLLDWNGNGCIDPADIAIMLALAEKEGFEDAFDDEDEQEDPTLTKMLAYEAVDNV